MIDDLLELVLPGGFWLGLGVVVGAAFGEQLRPVAKVAIQQAWTLAERAQEVGAEAMEKAQDLVAEARYEQLAAASTTRRNGARARPRRPRNQIRVAPAEE